MSVHDALELRAHHPTLHLSYSTDLNQTSGASNHDTALSNLTVGGTLQAVKVFSLGDLDCLESRYKPS